MVDRTIGGIMKFFRNILAPLLFIGFLSQQANSAVYLVDGQVTDKKVNFTAPTLTSYLSSSGDFTVPAGAKRLEVEMVGGGGGGGGSGTTAPTTASSGDSTTFGTSLLTAGGGQGGSSVNGAGGTCTVNSPATGYGVIGQSGNGSIMSTSGQVLAGVAGGNSFFGGAGVGIYNSAGGNAVTNSGSGGASGSALGNGVHSGNGGGAGCYIKAQIAGTLSSTYAYKVGSGGSGGASGTSGAAGGNGAAGMIRIRVYYQ